MNRNLAIFLTTMASVAATGANAQERALKANIPFDFTVGNTLDAGQSPHDHSASSGGSLTSDRRTQRIDREL